MNLIEEYIKRMPWMFVTNIRILKRKATRENAKGTRLFYMHMGAPEILDKEFAIYITISSSLFSKYINLEYNSINLIYQNKIIKLEDVAILHTVNRSKGDLYIELIAKSYEVIDNGLN